MSALLSKKQKGEICIQARQAFDHQIETGLLGDAAEFTEWRQSQQLQRAGKESLTQCTQDDYAPLLAHFYKLAGEDGLALKWLTRAQTEPRRVALAKLGEACFAAGVTYPDYPAAICWRVHKCSLDDASPAVLWKLFYTVRNRRDAKHGRALNHQPSTINHPVSI